MSEDNELTPEEWDKPTAHGPLKVVNGLYVCMLCGRNVASAPCRTRA